MPAPDYSRLIDAETWAFIRETERWYPPETAGFTIAEQRAVYDRMCKAFDRPHPPGVRSRDAPVGGVSCRVYEAGRAAVSVIYFHGGGFVVGGLHSHDAICAELCAATGFRVVSADYRLSPEHLHPAAFDDALAVTIAAGLEFDTPLVLAGDSAGGTLAAAVSHALRGQESGIAGQVLIYPGLGGDVDAGSYLEHAQAPMLTREDVLIYQGIRYAGGIAPGAPDATASPLQDTDFSGLPPTLVIVAECDPIADDGRLYAGRLLAAGGRAMAITEPGLVHGYLRARHSVARAGASFARIAAGVSALGRGDWPPVAE
jgi:acetyl esterase